MTPEKLSAAIKTGILFFPLQLLQRNPFVHLLTLTKGAGTVQYNSQEL